MKLAFLYRSLKESIALLCVRRTPKLQVLTSDNCKYTFFLMMLPHLRLLRGLLSTNHHTKVTVSRVTASHRTLQSDSGWASAPRYL
jgi:hypothetical protein